VRRSAKYQTEEGRILDKRMADFGTNRLQKIELKDRRILVIATAEFWTQDNRTT
jgi:hypothetical protein